MYKIISDTGQVIGYTDEVRYIKKHSNGCYVQCGFEEAEGVAFKSTPYSLDTEGHLEGAEGTVSLLSEDETDEVFKQSQDISETQDGLMETYDLTAEAADDMADVRTALEEIYEMIIGGEDNG